MNADLLNLTPSAPSILEQESVSSSVPKAVVTDHIVKVKTEQSRQLDDYQLDDTFISFLSTEEIIRKISDRSIKPSAIFVDADADKDSLEELRTVLATQCIPYILFTGKFDPDAKNKAVRLQVDD